MDLRLLVILLFINDCFGYKKKYQMKELSAASVRDDSGGESRETSVGSGEEPRDGDNDDKEEDEDTEHDTSTQEEKEDYDAEALFSVSQSSQSSSDSLSSSFTSISVSSSTPQFSDVYVSSEEEEHNRVAGLMQNISRISTDDYLDEDPDSPKDEGSGKREPEELEGTPQNQYQTSYQSTYPTTSTTRAPELVADYPMAPPMLKGERGEPGLPGPPGLPGIPGPMGPPGVCEQKCPLMEPRLELTAADVERIARYPGVKGEKGERGQSSEAKPYHHSQYSVEPIRSTGEKGQKGDPGYPGPAGIPGIPGPRGSNGLPGPPGPPGRDGASSGGGQGGVRVYETAVELFSSSPLTPVGCLAFALSSQQLFIRVNNGWQGVKLDGFYPSMERKPSAPIYMANAPAKDHLSYWRDISQHSTPAPPLPYTRPVLDEGRANKYNQYNYVHKEKPQKDGNSPYQNTVDSRLSPHYGKQRLHLIALNELYRGDMRGIRGADLECYRQARRSGFKTTFRAFLSSKVQDLNKIVFFDDRKYPVVNVRGDRLFDSWESLFTGKAPQAKILSFNGIDQFSNRKESGIWHGSNAAGNRVTDAFCNGWRSERHSDYGMATFVGPQAQEIMVEPREVSCDRELIVLCVENMSAFSARRRVGKRISEDF